MNMVKANVTIVEKENIKMKQTKTVKVHVLNVQAVNIKMELLKPYVKNVHLGNINMNMEKANVTIAMKENIKIKQIKTMKVHVRNVQLVNTKTK